MNLYVKVHNIMPVLSRRDPLASADHVSPDEGIVGSDVSSLNMRWNPNTGLALGDGFAFKP
jgi:hypothetical protein